MNDVYNMVRRRSYERFGCEYGNGESVWMPLSQQHSSMTWIWDMEIYRTTSGRQFGQRSGKDYWKKKTCLTLQSKGGYRQACCTVELINTPMPRSMSFPTPCCVCGKWDTILWSPRRNKFGGIQKPTSSVNWIEVMERRWSLSGRSSQDSRQRTSSMRFRKWWAKNSVIEWTSKAGSSSYQCSTTLYGMQKEMKNYVKKSKRVEEYARRFPRGHWSFPRLGSEKKRVQISKTSEPNVPLYQCLGERTIKKQASLDLVEVGHFLVCSAVTEWSEESILTPRRHVTSRWKANCAKTVDRKRWIICKTHGIFSVEVKVPSLFEDQTTSWIRIVNGLKGTSERQCRSKKKKKKRASWEPVAMAKPTLKPSSTSNWNVVPMGLRNGSTLMWEDPRTPIASRCQDSYSITSTQRKLVEDDAGVPFDRIVEKSKEVLSEDSRYWSDEIKEKLSVAPYWSAEKLIDALSKRWWREEKVSIQLEIKLSRKLMCFRAI